ncbi:MULTISPECIES: DUF2288 domain-containing protein [Rheinheimera]|jgi:hypothetical protein|uniref:DUF2288 domain-containing protein n=1 Tax=Rheinheimera tangshanensis TaxID=400153 RepID=A0A5C8M1H1_9GAMM|nr:MULTISPECIES: DUF2288 domain-containing protein [Rheinheimera]KOO58705.1 hypothetical protein WH43_07600 [Rheinheimera sp. KL1]TXK82285.1 DUF2288 domain-containing protein [Rheinheimera tangshanensis]GGM53590.1 hypothetical protein GCM10010920_12460 [Rheinheimera tangshanensis]
MHENFDVEPDVLKAKIISETARINWLELQKFYAAGSVVQVSAELDLVDVAFAFSQDDKAAVENWLQAGLVDRVADTQAQLWVEQKAELWAVVISPWILVQDKAAQATH